MRHLNLSSRFNKIVSPVRFIGLGIAVLGLLRIAAAADLLGLLIAIAGSIVWQCGTFLEERSPGFRALNSTLARDVMRTERIDVSASLNVQNLRQRLLGSIGDPFFVCMQDGYESGIVLPEHLETISDTEARYLRVGEVAMSVSSVDSIRDDDTVFTALMAMDRYGRDYVLVLDRDEQLQGVVTRNAIAGTTRDHTIEPVLNSPVQSECSRAKAA
jgi:signal-transduction protein with cAMP-binding, CBS, and nucleotidyltransferase domain